MKLVGLNWFAAPDEMDGLGWTAGWGNLVINGLAAAVGSVAEKLALIPEKIGREGPAVTVVVLDAHAGEPEYEIN